MASISTDGSGNRRILFMVGKKRQQVRLGKTPLKTCREITTRIETILAAKNSGTALDSDTATWLGKIGDELHEKLVAKGLAEPRAGDTRAHLESFLNTYIGSRTDLKAGTKELLGYARDHLVEFFGAQRQMHMISEGDAEDFRRHLMTKMGENTARRMCGRAKQFFRYAVRKRYIAENPFQETGSTSCLESKGREFFVSRDVVQRVLDACPDGQWRLLVALARYGGLRCPSEPLVLKWGDVDWERGRLRVTSPKTAHHEGKGSRWIPLFPELKPYLTDAFDAAEPGTEHVITRYRDPSVNLRTHFERIIRKAGFEPWPKPWQNLRSTRETELAETYPIHVVCAWIGNSEAVARKHYLQVTDEHFEQAAQNPAQQASVLVGSGGQATKENPGITRGFSQTPTYTHVQAAQQGFEP